MDQEAADRWSAIAVTWSSLWGGLADPARRELIRACGIAPGQRVLDVGCGSGELLRLLAQHGARASGADPAPGMLQVARDQAPEADLRLGSFESLDWPEHSFDAVLAVNSMQFAEDSVDAVAEAARVTVPGGSIGVANWAERTHNDLDALEAAVAEADGEEAAPDGELRLPGGLEAVLEEAGLTVVASGIVECPWDATNDDELARAVLMGEDEERIAEWSDVVLRAATPFRRDDGGYTLRNAFRWAVARTPG